MEREEKNGDKKMTKICFGESSGCGGSYRGSSAMFHNPLIVDSVSSHMEMITDYDYPSFMDRMQGGGI